ncbi:MAG: hypothetical protein EXS05_03675 [Planctomycetaceae bacterium]|nr:hypothetical protein [Planctomycetaceae bacterium]
MNAINATWKNGQIVPDQPVDWPDGCALRVEPRQAFQISGMTEEQQADDPESIALWLAEFNAIPPLCMTPDEEAEMLIWRRAVKEFNIDAVRSQMGLNSP